MRYHAALERYLCACAYATRAMSRRAMALRVVDEMLYHTCLLRYHDGAHDARMPLLKKMQRGERGACAPYDAARYALEQLRLRRVLIRHAP